MPRTDRVVGVAVATAALLSIGMVASGCGGGQGDRLATVTSVPTTPAPAATVPRQQTNRRRGSTHRAPQGGGRLNGRSQRQRAFQRAAGRIPESQRARLTTKVTRLVFLRFGFTSSTFTATSAGNGVRAVMDRGEACTATPQTERILADSVQKAVPWLQSVQIVVGQTREPMSRYVRAHCSPPTLSGGKGIAVLTQQGSLFGSTSAFTVHSKRWTIEYLNGSDLLQIIPTKGGRPRAGPLIARKRGTGHFVVDGDGTYTLQISSVGEWTVRVRDGA